MADLTQPKSIHWVDGSEEEYDQLCDQMVRSGTLVRLNQELWPGCFYARSDANDVARVESRTFMCSLSKDSAGPTNNWVNPFEMHTRLKEMFSGAMAGRTMYVLAFSMGRARFADVAHRRAADRFALRGRQHADHGPHRPAGAARDRPQQSSASCRACTASARRSLPVRRTSPGRAIQRSTSSTFPRRGRSGPTARATAAMRCSARSVSACASPPTSRATKAGWPSTC